MTWLSDSAELVAGGWLSSAYPGHGIAGASVPSTGTHGPAILYPGLSLPAEASDEFRALILTQPSGLSLLQIGEDSSIAAAGPDGVYTGTWRGYKNGVVYGPDPSTYTLTIGTGASLTGGAALDGVGAGGGLAVAGSSGLAGGAVLDGVGAGGSLGSSAGWEAALNIYTLLAPVDQVDNLGGFAPKGPDETVTLGFEFKRFTATPTSATVTITRHRGAPDTAPQNVKLGSEAILGSKVFQRVQGGVLYCDYLVDAVVTAPDGSVYSLEGILPIRPG